MSAQIPTNKDLQSAIDQLPVAQQYPTQDYLADIPAWATQTRIALYNTIMRWIATEGHTSPQRWPHAYDLAAAAAESQRFRDWYVTSHAVYPPDPWDTANAERAWCIAARYLTVETAFTCAKTEEQTHATT